MSHIRILTSARELESIRPLWELLYAEGQGTVFQNFDWNLLAARQFSDREVPFVVCAEASYGAGIVPGARLRDGSLRLLGEHLFDYRGCLYHGEEEVLRSALSALAQAHAPLEVVAVRECDLRTPMKALEVLPFTLAPAVNCEEISAAEFGGMHNRLGRNLRRFRRQGFDVKAWQGKNCSLVRSLYQNKAALEPDSLFHDPLRVEFMVEAARLQGERCEVFTLESVCELAAALVTFRDDEVRRFYTCYFCARCARLSPAMALIHEVTRQSLASGLNCDYMTGEQGYKLRLATSAMPLYRLRATPEQLAELCSFCPEPARAGEGTLSEPAARR